MSGTVFHIFLNLLYYSQMRYAILADIHANLEAFTAVLGDIEHKGGVEEIWCLGDVVGYGPDPGPCIELLQKYDHVCVAGNHDRAAIGKLDLAYFNPMAADASRWTTTQLNNDHVQYLENLPLSLDKGDFLLVHGSPMDPVMEYVMSTGIAARNFEFLRQPFCLVGHTHVPIVFKEEGDFALPVVLSPGIGMLLGASRMIINPGGVGQPRDGDPRASYAIYEDESRVFRLYRIPYDIGTTQDKMMQAGLPIHLITRLGAGQ